MSWPEEAADVFYLIGLCFMRLKIYQSALDAFNSAVKISPEFPKVGKVVLFVIDLFLLLLMLLLLGHFKPIL